MAKPHSLTELLGKIDWRRMNIGVVFDIRNQKTSCCPIIEALGYEDWQLNKQAQSIAVKLGYDANTVEAVIEAADWNPSWRLESSAAARWRHWQMEQIRRAHAQEGGAPS